MAEIYRRPRLSGELEESESFKAEDQSRHFQINMKFSCQVVLELEETFLYSLGLAFSPEIVLSETVFDTMLLLPRISDMESPDQQQFFKNLIGYKLNLSEDDADGMSTDVIQNAVEFMSSSPPDHKIFNLGFKLYVVHSQTYGELIEQMMEESAAADGPKMVPATEESIKNLKRKRVQLQDDCDQDSLKRKRVQDQECVICLEELTEEVSVLMPCSHSFHGDCIEKWLKTSHYCPICRFEMPTS